MIKNISADEYHSDRTHLASSSLVMIAKSPKHFKYELDSPPAKPTPAQETGTLIHSLLLEQDIDTYVPRPLKENGELVRSNTKEYAAFLEANPGKSPIHPNEYNQLYTMLTAFAENKRAMQMLRGAAIEQSVFTADPETGLLVKGRPDIWGKGYLADLKSTSNMERFENQIFGMLYDVRLMHYAKCIEFETGERIREFYFISYEQKAPFDSQIFQLSPGDVSMAEDKWRIFLNQVAVCTKENSWPGYSDMIRVARRPKYLEDESISFEEAM